ncbi:MAG: cobalamin-binding protein [Rubrobacteraceae bacterium]
MSLLPSATEMVHFAGAGDSLAGVTHECDYPPGVEKLPRLTSSRIDHHNMTSAEIDAAVGQRLTDDDSIYALDADLLDRLSPDLIVTQGLCEVCSVSLNLVERVAAGLTRRPEVFSTDPTSLREVLDDTIAVGELVGKGEETSGKVVDLEERLSLVGEAVADLERPRVGCIEWLDPPFSAGHWVPEMVNMAGGEELFAGPGERSGRLAWEAVFEADPDVLVIMPCGFDVNRALQEARQLADLDGWEDLTAVREDRVWVVDANSYFSRPAPRLVRGVEVLGHILHPEAFPDAPGPAEAVKLAGARSTI